MTHHTEAERATFSVSVLYDAANYTDVVAESPEAAAIAAEEKFGIVSLCHQCTDDIGLGDIVGAHVYKDGQLVLDTTSEGRIASKLADANARIAELTLELQAARRAPALPVPQGWKMVPVEPTREMIDAMPPVEETGYWAMYEAALAAAPQPPEAAPQCWCETCRPQTLDDMRFIMCPDCGNKRCPKANNHANACTNSNAPGQKGSSWENVKPFAQSPATQLPDAFQTEGGLKSEIRTTSTAPVQMPEPDGCVVYANGESHHWDANRECAELFASSERSRGAPYAFTFENLYTEQKVRQLLADNGIGKDKA